MSDIMLYKDHEYFISPMIRNSLGNNLFQIAAICSYAHDENVKYIIEDTEYTGIHKTYNKNITLCKLFPNLKCIKSQQYYWDLYLCEEKKDNSEDIIPINKYISKKIRTKIIGTFISYKYFNHNREYILKLLDFNTKIKKKILYKYKNIFDNYITISVHIRRGDFIKKLYLKKWCLLGVDYYKNTIDLLLDKFKNKNLYFLFFHEDEESKQWIMNNLIQLINNYNYKLLSNLAHEDIILMSLCNHNIIANSTFSYWGAYFNNNNNRIILAPSSWKYNETELDNNKRYPPSWIIIKSICNITII